MIPNDYGPVCLSVFSCTVLFVSISQVIGCEDRLRDDLYCVGWGVKLYSNKQKPVWVTNGANHYSLTIWSTMALELKAFQSKVV